ncbi:MAG TPA: DUF5317 domain-containing protein [Egibacteraceae bacterium]|nr:DUF5317 domain-containing protein [Egibacteraceae bacterium]
MSLVATVVLLAVAIGYAAGGRLRHIAQIPFRRIWMVWIAFLLQFLLPFLDESTRRTLRVPILAVAFVLAMWWIVGTWPVLTRWLRAGLVLVVVGWAMNFTVIALNNGMPVSAETLDRVGLPSDNIESGDLNKHVTLDDDTLLPWLGDMIPLPLAGPLRKAISLGDVVMLLGLLVFIPVGMRQEPDEATA